MHQTRETLRRKWSLGHSHREVARSLGVSVGAISAVRQSAAEAGLEDFEALAVLSERELEARLYGRERLEAACARAVSVRARSYRHVQSILKNGLDRIAIGSDDEREARLPLVHENVRGKERKLDKALVRQLATGR